MGIKKQTICKICGQPVASNRHAYCSDDCRKRGQRQLCKEWRQRLRMNHPDQYRAYLDRQSKEARRAAAERWRKNHPESIRQKGQSYWLDGRGQEVQRQYQLRLKIAALDAYGGRHCACCGETIVEFLCIDHINGGGGQHVKQIGGGGTNLYRWLRKNNYPSGYQVLCYNCNAGKSHYGQCPHQRIKGDGADGKHLGYSPSPKQPL